MAETEVIKAHSFHDKHPKTLRRVAAYCRVSTDSEEQATSYKSQVTYYREKIRNTPGWLLAGVYADEGISGTSFDKRKEFKRMIDDCLAGRIDMVLTKSLSRFSRNTEDTIKYVRLLRDRAIPIIFEEEHINTCSMDGELMLTILGAIYQQEVENTSNHVKLGFKMKMKRGEMVGRPDAYGYDYDKINKCLIINPEEAEVVRWIFEQYVAGMGGRKIAIMLGERKIKAPRSDYWCSNVVLGIIKNVKYRGDLLLGKVFTSDPIRRKQVLNFGEREKYYVRNHHEAIVEPEIFDKAQEILSERRKKLNLDKVTGKHLEKKHREVFVRKIYCAECGKAFIKRRNTKRSGKPALIKWQCGGYANTGSNCQNTRAWNNSWIEEAFVESFNLLCRTGDVSMDSFLDVMKTVLRKKERERKAVEKYVKSEIIILQKQMDDLLSRKLDGSISEQVFAVRYDFLRKELDKATVEAYEVASQVTGGNSLTGRIRDLQIKLRKLGPLAQFDAKIFDAVVERVMIGKEGDTEYITFIYRDGEDNSFKLDKFQKAVEIKRQLNMVSAHHKKEKVVSATPMYSAVSKQGKALLPPEDKQGNLPCAHKENRSDLKDGVTTEEEISSSVFKALNKSKLPIGECENCSMHSVNEQLCYGMNTKNDISGTLDMKGMATNPEVATKECSMCSVNRCAHCGHDYWHYGHDGCAAVFFHAGDSQYGQDSKRPEYLGRSHCGVPAGKGNCTQQHWRFVAIYQQCGQLETAYRKLPADRVGSDSYQSHDLRCNG